MGIHLPRSEPAMRSAVIVDIVRTPSGKGKAGGGLADVHPATLLACVLSELVARNDLDPAVVDDVIGGCVTPSGEQAPHITPTARRAAHVPETVPANHL